MTRKEVFKRFGKVFARGLLLFMTAAVVLKLLLNQEWWTASIIFALSWAVGEFVSYAFRKYDTAKILLLKAVTAAIAFVVIAFITGVMNNHQDWLVMSRTVAGTYAISAFVSPMWQK